MPATWVEVKKELIAIAHAFDVEITENKIRFYCEIWKHMTPEQVMDGLRIWSLNAKVKRLPLPGEISNRLPGEVVAARILQAVGKFGYTDPKGAMEFLGDCWVVVTGMGGWAAICEHKSDKGVLIAQMRNLWNSLEGAIENGLNKKVLGKSFENKEMLELDGRNSGESLRENNLERTTGVISQALIPSKERSDT